MPTPLKLLHVGVGNLFGGIETLLVSLARERAHCATMEPHFAVCFEGRLSRELRAAGVPVTDLGPARVRYPWTIGRVRRRLSSLIARERFDAVVVHGCWAHAIAGPAVTGQGVPLVHWAHAGASGHWLERWARGTTPALVIANSRYTAGSVKELFPGIEMTVLYCPVPAPPPRDRAAVCVRTRSALATPLDATVIIMASRLESWKGHRLLLEALSGVAGEPGWVCWIAGGPQRRRERRYERGLRARANTTGIADRVRFLGHRDDVADLLASADIYCQPNEAPEPFGIALVEALYAGLPVVTTGLGGAIEIVDDSCGRLVPPHVIDLSEAVRGLLRSRTERERLGGNGQARARSMCEPARRIAQLHQTLAPFAKGLRHEPN